MKEKPEGGFPWPKPKWSTPKLYDEFPVRGNQEGRKELWEILKPTFETRVSHLFNSVSEWTNVKPIC